MFMTPTELPQGREDDVKKKHTKSSYTHVVRKLNSKPE